MRLRMPYVPRPLVRSMVLLVTLVVVFSVLAGCSLSPLGNAETPTSPPSPALPSAAPPPTAPAVEATPAPAPATSSGSKPVAGQGPDLIAGKFSYTNNIITTYYVEHAAALVDMYGFVKRDREWKIPVDSQVLGYLAIDEKSKSGEYRVQLPERPQGQLVDVDHNGRQDAGVQVFATSYWPNSTGGPYSEGDDPSFGWPSYLASTVNDTENNDEVIGGKLVVWSPDSQQQFPTGFGPDAKLFTGDDPVGPIPAGYMVVDLDKKPFTFSQDAKQELTLYEPKDVAIKDFSGLSYVEAFKQMVDKLRVEYAFNGIAGKAPNWDELYSRFAPRIAEAERGRDAEAFSAAIHDFTLEFKDGHVGILDDPNVGPLFRRQVRLRDPRPRRRAFRRHIRAQGRAGRPGRHRRRRRGDRVRRQADQAGRERRAAVRGAVLDRLWPAHDPGALPGACPGGRRCQRHVRQPWQGACDCPAQGDPGVPELP